MSSKGSQSTNLPGKIATIGVLILLALTTFEVVVRRIFNMPTSWTLEFQQHVQVAIAMIGAAACLKAEGHVNMSLLIENVSSKAKELMMAANSLLGALTCALLCWLCWMPFKSAFLVGELTETAEIPVWPAKLLLPIGFLLLTGQFLIRMARHWAAYRDFGRRPLVERG